MYRGKEKCSGCHTSGEVKPRNGRNELCSDCKEALTVGTLRLKQLESLNEHDLIRLSFRTVFSMKEATVYRSDQIKILDKFILSFLRDNCITERYATNTVKVSEHLRVGVNATTCAWFTGVVYRKHWDMIVNMVKSVFEFVDDYVGDVKERENKAYQDGQNLLLNLQRDSTFLERSNHASKLK